MPDRLLRCLLWLFPPAFRAEFEGDVVDYVALRQRELRSASRWTQATLALHMAIDLITAAVKCRMAAFDATQVAAWMAASVAGLFLGTVVLSAVLIAFEHVVHTPLVGLAKTNATAVAAVARLALFAAVILVVFRCYVSLLPRPDNRRSPPE